MDYASNIAPRSFPDSLDTEVFSFLALEAAWTHADAEREHEIRDALYPRIHQFSDMRTCPM